MERNETRLASSSFSAMLHHSPVLNATLAGRAPSSHVLAKETLTFQSAYPRGTQYPTQFRDTTWNGCFNPRARVGRDASHCRPPSRKPWFQSTRPRGARPIHGADLGFEAMFQSTRPRGARLGFRCVCFGCRDSFNPRARVGRDGCAAGIGETHRHVSIHAPAWGATAMRRQGKNRGKCFNPRARVGRDSRRW